MAATIGKEKFTPPSPISAGKPQATKSEVIISSGYLPSAGVNKPSLSAGYTPAFSLRSISLLHLLLDCILSSQSIWKKQNYPTSYYQQQKDGVPNLHHHFLVSFEFVGELDNDNRSCIILKVADN